MQQIVSSYIGEDIASSHMQKYVGSYTTTDDFAFHSIVNFFKVDNRV